MSYQKSKAYWDKRGGEAAYKAEVKRKAQSGIALSNPTESSSDLYNSFKSASGGSSTPANGSDSDVIKALFQSTGKKTWGDSDGDGVRDYADDHKNDSTRYNLGQPSSVKPEINPYEEQLKMMQQQYADLMGQMGNMKSEWAQQLQQQAQQQAQQIAEQKRSALESLIDKLNTNQEVGLQQINNSVEDSRQALDDKTFQQYLAARQNMANRGLSGSGIASDQDTRLLLQKQRDLSGIYRDAATRQFQLGNQYRNQLDTANRQLSGINTGEIASEKFQELYNSGQDRLMDQAELYQGYLKDLMGYDIDRKNVDFKYDKMSTEDRQFYDQMGVEDRQFYDSLTQEGQIEEAKMLLDWQKHIVPSGNSTLSNQVKKEIASMDNTTKLQVAQLNKEARVGAAQIAADSREAVAAIRAASEKLEGSDQLGDMYTQITSRASDSEDAMAYLTSEFHNIVSRVGYDGFEELVKLNELHQGIEGRSGSSISGAEFVKIPSSPRRPNSDDVSKETNYDEILGSYLNALN